MKENRESPRQSGPRQMINGYTNFGRDIFEVKQGVRGARSLQTAILQIAYVLDKHRDLKGHLVLIDPKLSEGRILSEWEKASRVLREPIQRRLHIIIAEGDNYTGIPGDPSRGVRSHLPDLIAEERRQADRLPRPHYFFVVLKILLHQWLTGAGPVTTLWLARAAGCSYPTVSKALTRLKGVIKRHPYRKVELDRFPREAWGQLLANSDSVRMTTRFSDRSGKPRLPEDLVHRLQKLDRSGLAVGGSIGARHWYSDLDLVGNPRLDISIHCPHGPLDLAFVRQIDPALETTTGPLEPATLVVHAVRREVSFFEPGPDGPKVADPVECLLDLHEMRFEQQAQEFVRSLSPEGVNP